MGIDISQWRSKIGCFSPNLKTNKRHKWLFSEGIIHRVLYSTFFFSRVCLCITLLLLLSGDVEVNPGPIENNYKSKFPLQGNFHQGNELFSFNSRGRQCLPCCVVFLIKLYAKDLKIYRWKSVDLDLILFQGDYLYKFAKQFIRDQRHYFEPHDLPSFIKIDHKFYMWKVKKTLSGSVHKDYIGEYPLVKLELAISIGLSGDESQKRFGIFVCKGNSVAISKEKDFFIVLDSHSRNAHGLCCPNGTSVVILKKTAKDLCDHLRSIIGANEKIEQYDFHVIKVNQITEKNILYKHKVSKNEICHVPDILMFETMNVQPNLDSVKGVTYECSGLNRVSKLNDLPIISSIEKYLEKNQSCGKDSRKKPPSTSGPKENNCKSTFPLLGNFHQGNDIFSLDSRGRQCLPCCVIFLIELIAIPPNINRWKSVDLDHILLQGDHLYKFAKAFIRSPRSYLEPRDLPPFIEIDGNFFKWRVEKTYSGSIQKHFIGEYPLVKLELAMSFGLSGHECEIQFGIFVCKGNALAIARINDSFIVFDSHSRNANGYCCTDGTSVVILKKTETDLCDHLRSVIGADEKAEQYDFHVIKVKKTSQYHIQQKHKASEVDICHVPDTSILKSVNSNHPNLDPVTILTSDCTSENGVQFIGLPFLNPPEKYGKKRKRKDKEISAMPSSKKICVKCPNNLTKSVDSPGDIISKFHEVVLYGPEYVCISCSQVFFRHSVKDFQGMRKLSYDIIKHCVTSIKSVDNKQWLCSQCIKYFKDGKIPPCSVGNGLRFPKIPKELQGLTKLEERLISPRIPFMQIKELPRGGQLAVHGNVVNVPADVNKTVKLLPRNMDASETIPIKLKRSVNFKSHIAFEQVRPERILSAAEWLIQNSRLFRNEGITLNTNWNEINQETLLREKEIVESANNGISDGEQVRSEIDSDRWSEDDGAVLKPSGNFDTVMQPADFREFNRILNVAPAEGNVPLGMFQDIYAEFLSFPAIYCGETRPDNNSRATPVHYSTICKWELRNVDRRAATNVTNIFFKLKKLQIKQISDKVSLAVRKCKLNGKKLTVNEVISEGSVDKIIKHDEGYRVLRTLRGSPPYWQRTKKDIYAMIRQIGIPTWFCSFSAAETKWKTLLRILGKLVKNTIYTDSDIAALSWFEKNELIKSDPVTCARFFDFRFQMFLKNVLMHKTSPIGKINDFFIRVEFQQRGSPHVHILFWIDGAPSIGSNTDDEIGNFVDKYVTCKKNSQISALVNYQTHRHARTCRKKGKCICRFGFPLPPLDKTMILQGLEDNVDDTSKAHKDFNKVMSSLDSLKSGDNSDMTLEMFLKSLNLTYNDYILALRSNIKAGQRKMYLKRNVSEIRINNYNELLIKGWEANMDIQYILDPYACAAYIVSYISKGQRGMSNLLSNACEEAKRTGSDIKQQVRKVGNTFLTNVEIGSQEACYLVLGMPLKRSSRDVVFVDTNTENDRVVLIKPKSALAELPKTSTSIESDSNIKRYQRRPYSMKLVCLADFMALFNIHYPKKGRKTPCEQPLETVECEELPETVYELNSEDDLECPEATELREEHVFKDGTVMVKRKVAKIIYSVSFNKENDKENFYREQLMLYLPWGKYSDILSGYMTYEARYTDNLHIIEMKRKNYVCDRVPDMSLLEHEVSLSGEEPAITEAQHQDEGDVHAGSHLSQEFGCFNPGSHDGSIQYDLGLDLNIGRKQIQTDDEQLTGEMTDDEYRELVQKLNLKQKEFFYHVLNWMKTEERPLYNFLSGGAGVGKSVLLKALNQALVKYFSHKAGENPDEIKVLICAPTGKAAFNVGGCTVHSAFNIPAEQGLNFKPLDIQQLSSFQSKFKSLKVVFIDEISMVGKKMFNYVNLRLQEIMGCLKPFGGVSVIAFGDLYQLKPVMDHWIFTSNYSSDNSAILAPNVWIDDFLLFELDQIMRQKDDLRFAQILNRLREGHHTPEDINILKQQILEVESDATKNMPHLFTRRLEVDDYNRTVFDQLAASKKTVIKAIDTISGDLPESTINKILTKLPDEANKSKGLAKKLHLGEDLPAEICVNIEVADGLTNGAPCTIKKLDYRVLGSTRCSIVWVQFCSQDIGKKCRSQFKHLFNSTISSSWTPILEITRKFNFNYYQSFCITRRQFPLTLASAKTVHKAQGSTLENAVIGLGCRKLEHMYYVALSRVQNLSSVYLLDFNENCIKISSSVVEEMERLRTSAQVIISIPILYHIPENVTKIVFHNCRSLKKHIADIKRERSLLSADILAFAETCLKPRDTSIDFELISFDLSRNDDMCCSERPYHGTAVYSRIFPNSFKGDNIFNVELTCGYFLHENLQINICFVYCPPKIASLSLFKKFFAHLDIKYDLSKPHIIMGDFNLDFWQVKMLPSFLCSKYSLKQIIDAPTTNYETVLDHVYTNIEKHAIYSSGVLESYFSDHKPIYIALR